MATNNGKPLTDNNELFMNILQTLLYTLVNAIWANTRSTSRYLLLITALLGSAITIPATAYQSVDKIIAIVGDDVIFASELTQKTSQVSSRLKAQGREVNNSKMRQQLLERLILERLQLRIAEDNKLTISDNDINQMIEHTRKNIERNGSSFDEYLSQQNLTLADARRTIEQEIKIERIQQGVINRRINITEREIDNFLNSKAGKEWLTTRYRLAHILLPIDANNEQQILSQAQALYAQAKETNANFAQLASTHSKGPNASKGGDLGYRKKEELPELFLQQVTLLNIGEVTRPFKSGAGIHLLKLIELNGAKPVVIEQSKVRHLLVKVTELFTQEEALAKIKQLHQRIINGEDFATLAKEHTDDIGSKLSGGELGWSNPGQFVPQFEKNMNATAVNAVSEPFLSQFGWHILTIDDRRKKDVFDTVKRNQVVKLLRDQRFQDELQIWLQELRDNAYVEILSLIHI